MTSGEKNDQPGDSTESPSDEAGDAFPPAEGSEGDETVDRSPETDREETEAASEEAEETEQNTDEQAADTEESDESEGDDPANAAAEDGETEEAAEDGKADAESQEDDDQSAETESDDDEEDGETEDDDDETDEDDDDEEDVDSETDGGAVAEEEGGILDGAPDDQEMPLTAHIEEMIKRMLAVIVVMGGVSLIVFPVSADVANFLWYSYLPAPSGGITECVGDPEDGACPRVYHPLGLLITRLKVASLAGLIVALPVFVYQTYLFMRPGLYPQERKYYLASVPTSLVLALVGVAFAYFLILPFIFEYFMFYSAGVVEESGIAFGLVETFDLILLMMGLFALIFQIPLFMMLAIMMGITTRLWLEDKRIIFWVVFAGVAFLFSPDPTGMAPLMVALTMIGLFEITLLLLRWTGR